MIFYVLQEQMQDHDQTTYYSGGVNVPRTVLIPEKLLIVNKNMQPEWMFPLRIRSRKKLLQDAKLASVFHNNFPLTLPGVPYNWGDYTSTAGLIDTGENHYSPTGNKWGLSIPPTVVANWGLVEGDQVGMTVHHQRHLICISSVNGIQNPDITRMRKDIHYQRVAPPKDPLKIEQFNDFDLRVMTLLAPIGYGQSYWVFGAGGSGKTWMKVKMAEALIKLTRVNPRLRVIITYIERPGEAELFLEMVEAAKSNQVEFFQSPWSDSSHAQVATGVFAINRAKTLASHDNLDVVLLLDSVTRLVGADSDIKAGDRLLSGGLDRSSIGDIIQGHLGVYGFFPETGSSLTTICTALYATDKDISSRSSTNVLVVEVGENATSGTLHLRKNPTLGWPRIDVDSSISFTRQPKGHDFRSDDQVREMDEVFRLMWVPTPREEKRDRFERDRAAETAHARLLQYCRENPFPQY